jgi:hypothetical protein
MDWPSPPVALRQFLEVGGSEDRTELRESGDTRILIVIDLIRFDRGRNRSDVSHRAELL